MACFELGPRVRRQESSCALTAFTDGDSDFVAAGASAPLRRLATSHDGAISTRFVTTRPLPSRLRTRRQCRRCHARSIDRTSLSASSAPTRPPRRSTSAVSCSAVCASSDAVLDPVGSRRARRDASSRHSDGIVSSLCGICFSSNGNGGIGHEVFECLSFPSAADTAREDVVK